MNVGPAICFQTIGTSWNTLFMMSIFSTNIPCAADLLFFKLRPVAAVIRFFLVQIGMFCYIYRSKWHDSYFLKLIKLSSFNKILFLMWKNWLDDIIIQQCFHNIGGIWIKPLRHVLNKTESIYVWNTTIYLWNRNNLHIKQKQYTWSCMYIVCFVSCMYHVKHDKFTYETEAILIWNRSNFNMKQKQF